MYWYLYILKCDQKVFYVGITKNISLRYKSHKNGDNKYTKRFTYFELMYTEKHKDKFSAAKREKQVKGWSRSKKIKLIDGTLS